MAGRGGAEVMVNREVVEKPEAAGPTQGQFRIEEQLPSGQGLAMPAADRVETVANPTGASTAALAAGSAEVPFAEANHSEIITGIRTHLLPSGGSMRIWLDPPELGAMQVTVQIEDGVVTASFETSNDDATRLLSHSLHQLKQSLEVQGISVDKLQVEQLSREKFGGGTREEGERGQPQDRGSQQEQQRREMLQRMWRRLRGGSDALDVTG
jgi:flagellar hook-length control protein FliK